VCVCVCVCVLIMSALTSGPNCQTNINECASNPCLNQGTCIDDVAGYKCNCVLPYTGTTVLEVFLVLVWCSGIGTGRGGEQLPHPVYCKLLGAKRKNVRRVTYLSSKVQRQDFLWAQRHLIRELENIVMSSDLLFDKTDNDGK